MTTAVAKNSMTFKEAVEAYIAHIVKDYTDYSERSKAHYTKPHIIENIDRMVEEFGENITFTMGRKYVKVISRNSVHSFIVVNDDGKFKAGDILKPAGWASPARNHARGNIFGDYASVTWTGPEYM